MRLGRISGLALSVVSLAVEKGKVGLDLDDTDR